MDIFDITYLIVYYHCIHQIFQYNPTIAHYVLGNSYPLNFLFHHNLWE